MKVRWTFIFGLVLVSTSAFAKVSYQGFSWRADSRFQLILEEDGESVMLKGNLRQADKAQAKADGLTADLVDYKEGFITITVAQEGDDVGSVFLIERQNANFVLLNSQPIRERRATLNLNLSGVFAALKSKNKWDASLSIRAMVEYFRKNPSQQLANFYDQVENDHVRVVPKPNPLVLNQDAIRPTGSPADPDQASDGGAVELPPPPSPPRSRQRLRQRPPADPQEQLLEPTDPPPAMGNGGGPYGSPRRRQIPNYGYGSIYGQGY